MTFWFHEAFVLLFIQVYLFKATSKRWEKGDFLGCTGMLYSCSLHDSISAFSTEHIYVYICDVISVQNSLLGLFWLFYMHLCLYKCACLLACSRVYKCLLFLCIGMHVWECLCLCLHTQPIWPYEAALHWHVVDDRPGLMGMVISQVDLGTPWGMGSAWLSLDITRRHIQLHIHTHTHTPQAHEDDHIWYTDDILSLLWQHGLIFLLWHPLLCGCYSSQIYHFNGEVVRPEDYLRDKYIIVCSFGIDRVSLCPWLTLSRRMPEDITYRDAIGPIA